MKEKGKNKMSQSIVRLLVQKGMISEEDADIYLYGIRALAMLTLGTVCMLMIGFLLNEAVYTLSFFFAFASLRAFYQGIHLKSRFKCFLSSEILFLISLYCSGYYFGSYNWEVPVMIIWYLIMILWKTIPYVKSSKLNTPKQRQRYRTTMVISFLVLTLFLISVYLKQLPVAKGILSATICMSVLVIAEVVRRKICQERKRNDVSLLLKQHLL